MILACFIYKMAFDNKINYEYCCDNYIYNREKTGQVPVFKAYNMTVKLDIIYAGIVMKWKMHALEQANWFANRANVMTENAPKKAKGWGVD